MTYLQFSEVWTLPPNATLHFFSDKDLGTFHAFKVTIETKTILETRKEVLPDSNLSLLQPLNKDLWKTIFHYLTPRDIIKFVIATRNLNGLFSVNELMNHYIYIKNRIISTGTRNGGTIDTYQTYTNMLYQLDQSNQMSAQKVKIPLLAFEADQAVPVLNGDIFAGGLEAVNVGKQSGRGRNVLDLSITINQLTLSDHFLSLTRLNLSWTNLIFGYFIRFIEKATNLTHIDLAGCVSDCSSRRDYPFPESITLKRLVDLDLTNSKIFSSFVLEFFRIAPNLQRVRMLGAYNLQSINFNGLKANSLPSLLRLELCYQESTNSFMDMIRAAPNLKSLKLASQNPLIPVCPIWFRFFSELKPNDLQNIEELDLRGLKVKSSLMSILEAAPRLQRLILNQSYFRLDDPGTKVFPNIKYLDLFGSEMTMIDLLIMLTLMPNLVELDMTECSDLVDSYETDQLEPLMHLEKISCDTATLPQEVLVFLMSKAPNLKEFPLDFHIAPGYEKVIRKYDRLIQDGFKLVKVAFNEFLKNEPQVRSIIGKFLPKYLTKSSSCRDVKDEASSLKHQVEGAHDSPSKRQKMSDA